MAELVYIDEQPAEGRKVLGAAVNSGEFTEDQVVAIEPLNSIDETINKILEYNCKVLISDYYLSEYQRDVNFNGVELIREFQARYLMFPCFVTTAYAAEAVKSDYDINLIFPKSDFLQKKTAKKLEFPFFRRVRKKIIEYEKLLENTRARIQELKTKYETDNLSEAETQEFFSLDTQLEMMLSRQHCIDEQLKREAIEPIRNLVSKTEELIEKIEKELKSDQ